MKKVLPFTLTLVFLCITTINLFAQDLTIVGATGYTQDVVANGVGSMMSSTTTTADYNNYCFLSQDWKLNSGDAPIGVGLPAGGVIVSPDINGLTYQIPSAATPYGVNNSLRLNNYPSDLGTLTLDSPANYGKLYFLVTSGNGSSKVDVFVNFTDRTSQVFYGIIVPDWFETGLPVELLGFGYGQRADNVVGTPNNNPKLFRLELNIDVTNHSKQIRTVDFFKRDSSGSSILNIMAFSARPPFIIYDTLYVKKNVSGSNGVGDSWANAINNLQEAIDRPGVQQVFVAKGTYQPSTNSSFKMKNNVAIYGGFNDTGNPGMEDRDWIAYPTILNGSGSSVIHNLYTNGAPLGANAILDGFTITGGSIRGFGGGIFNMYASPTLTNLIITGNSATGSEGGGGGIYNQYSSPSLTNVIIGWNFSHERGGGMYNSISSPNLTNVTISGNSATEIGGGMYNFASNPSLINVTISGNTSTEGAEWYDPSGNVILRNSIIYGNGIYGSLGNSQNSIRQGYTDTTNGNINYTGSLADLFKDAANDDYRLITTSVAVNSGNNSHYPGLNANTKDLDGNPRVYNGIPDPDVIDMGAYEFQGERVVPFITKWKTDNLSTGSSNATSITIPTMGTGYNYEVSWKNDDVWESVSSNADKTHNYGTAGTYEVAIRGAFPRIYFNNVGDKLKIISVDQWGTIAWSSMENAFKGCKNLNGNPTDAPILFGVTNMAYMFDGADKFNQNIGNWNVSNVTNMSFMFRGASLFNQNIGNWNVSNVTTMSRMFYTASIFNQDISGWNVSNVTDMHAMFAYASLFNQNIGSWNVGNVSDMNSMFISANAFDQNIGSWNVSNVEDMTNMFNNNSLSTANYDALLNGWSSLLLKNGVSFSGGNSEYCDGTTARAIILRTSGWTITDGGNVAGCITSPDGNNILYINKNISSGSGRGNTWANAIPELADALKYATLQNASTPYTSANPLKIYVAKGTYKPLYSPEDGANFGTDQGRDNAFLMVNNVQLYGGFTGTEATLAERDLSNMANATTLSGDIGSLNNENDNTYHVVVSVGEVGEALLDGFIITAGEANIYEDLTINFLSTTKSKAGGMYNRSSSPSIANVTLIGNSATFGGGMYNHTSSPSMTNVTLSGNSAQYGSGMYNESSSSPSMTHVTLSENSANFWGGGMYNDNSSPSLTNVILSGNSAQHGGGMYNEIYSSPSLTNVILSGNSANVTGGGMYNDNSTPSLLNVTISGNSAAQGSEWYNQSGIPIIRNSIIYGNGISGILYNPENSILQGHANTTDGNINYTGSVVDLFTDVVNDDYSLKTGSVAINTGNNNHYPGLNSTTQDLKGNPRLYENIIDMGAYEFQGEPYSPAYFITKWKTDNLSAGSSNATSITIPTTGTGYNYSVSWKNDGLWENGITGSKTHDYGTAGTYTVAIRGDFPQIYFNNSGDKEKIISIEQWGTYEWSSMENAFFGCSELIGNATDAPDLSGVTNLAHIFHNASKFNKNIDNWNVTNVTDMSSMFQGASLFNQNISSWNVRNVTNMTNMFKSITLSSENYDALLIGWNALPLQNGVTFSGGDSKYCNSNGARNNLIGTFGWSITDGGRNATCMGSPDANNILYVNKNVSSGNNRGDSWANAIPELSDALKYAKQQGNYTSANPLKIYVAIGTYSPLFSPESGDLDRGRDNTFFIVKNVKLYGGFDPDNGITGLTQARILPSLEVSAGTILNGNNNVNHVVLSSGEVETALLDGFTITGGNAVFNEDEEEYDDIIVNQASIYKDYGGGMYYNNSSPSLTNVILSGNFANIRGGGIYNYNSSTRLTNVTISGNSTLTYGGGMFNHFSTPFLTNVTLTGNSSNNQGGGVFNNASYPRLTNVTISGNSASYQGGEWYQVSGNPLTINSIIYGNGIVGTIYNPENSILQGHADTDNGNINFTGSVADLFTDAANDDYSLKISSVAVNAGSNTAYTNAGGNLTTDLDLAGNPRLFQDSIDMGAYEYPGEPVIDYIWENNAWTPSNPSGVSAANDNILVINGTGSLTANTDIKNITINADATLEIHNILKLYGNVINNGNFVFVSSADGDGELGPVLANSTITGEATVQRYMSNNRSYRMVTSAVTTTTSIHDNWQEKAMSKTDNPSPGFGTHITGSTTDQQNGFDGTGTASPSMYTVDVAAQQFVPIANTDMNTLTAGEAFLLFVRGDRSISLNDNNASSETVLRATGLLYIGSKTLNFPTADAGDYIMVGNPYQSAVDIKSVLTNSTNLIPTFYYVYDPTFADFGKYVTVRLNSENGTNTDGSTANKFLQPGQGAQLAVLDLAPTIVFNESNKAPGNFTASNRNTMTEDNMLTVQLYTTENYNNGGPVHDSFGIIFEEDYNNEINFMDAIKPMNFYENLGINHNGTYLSIEEREMPQLGEVYPLFSTGYQHSEYTLKLTVDGLEAIALYLDDNFNATSTIIEDGDNTYSFSIDANDPLSKATDRFSIRTEERLGIYDNNLLSGIRLYPNPLDGNTFYISTPKLNGEQLLVRVYDLTGRRIFEQNLECQANIITVPMGNEVAAGVYLVTLNHKGKEQTYRLIRE